MPREQGPGTCNFGTEMILQCKTRAESLFRWRDLHPNRRRHAAFEPDTRCLFGVCSTLCHRPQSRLAPPMPFGKGWNVLEQMCSCRSWSSLHPSRHRRFGSRGAIHPRAVRALRDRPHAWPPADLAGRDKGAVDIGDTPASIPASIALLRLAKECDTALHGFVRVGHAVHR